MNDKSCRGILLRENGRTFLRDQDGTEYFSEYAIWEGYVKHWQGMMLRGKVLPEYDYLTGKPVVLLWPERETGGEPFVELYYNERLVKYTMSILGHLAINVNGSIFNFSHLLNECEIMTEEEYFYRPALGIFSPSPDGLFDLSDPERQYLDKFGRQFMRTIHTLRITGRDTSGLELILRRKLAEIYNTPLDPLTPEYWTGFNKFTNSCTTLIRDSLREWGYPAVSGIFPLELFINALWLFRKKQQSGEVLISLYRHNQLVVDEAPLSRLSPLLNPLNKIKKILISLSAKEKNLTF